MRRLVFVILVSCLLVTLLFAGKENIPAVKASPDIYQGDLVLAGNNVTVIEGRFDINGSILVEENASLFLNKALLNFTSGFGHGIYLQNPSNGNPRLVAHNTTIIGMGAGRYHGNGSVLFSNCSISGPEELYLYDESNVTIFDSDTEKNLQARDSSRVTIFGSTIELLALVMESANSSIHDLSAGFFDIWDFWLDCSVVVSPSGRAPNVTLNQTTIMEWSFSFQGSSYSEIFSSEIWLLHANENAHVSLHNSTMNKIELYGTSIVELTNSTHQLRQFYNEAKGYVSWYLFVHVVDSLIQNVPLANVTVTFSNATLAESKFTDAEGWAGFTLMEKMMNATGEYPVGNYTVEATYDIYSDATTMNMTENQQITLTFADFVIPEFLSFLILPLLMITTLLAVIVYRGKYSE
jgi:hypothetical protein